MKHVHVFLGLASYYRCFVLNFASLLAPLSDLTRKSEPEKLFQGQKTALTGTLVL